MDAVLKRLGPWLMVLVFALVFVYARITHTPKSSNEETATSMPAAVSGEQKAFDAQLVAIKMRNPSVEFNTKISIQYPELSGIQDSPSLQKINRVLEDFIGAQVDDFIKLVEAKQHKLAVLVALKLPRPAPYLSGQDAYLTVTSEVSRPTFAPNVISVGFNELYDAGLVHPMKSGEAFTFDLRTGDRILLDELFISGDGYSDAIVAYLQSTTSTISRTTFPCCAVRSVGPDDAFLITDEGLKLLFDQGDGLGNIPVTEKIIPWDIVRPFISPTGSLAGLLL